MSSHGMDANSGRGVVLAERLGIAILGREGHDLRCSCVCCTSSDAGRIHSDSGTYNCYACKAGLSRLQLAIQILGNEASAWQLLEDIGLEQSRRSNANTATEQPVNLLEAIAGKKGVQPASLIAYGAMVIPSGSVILPMFGRDGKQCSTFRIWLDGNEVQQKGKNERRKPTGLFLPVNDDRTPRLPAAGEEWVICEGVKESAAWHSLGRLACGTNGASIHSKLARLFDSVNVILATDRDAAGKKGVVASARALHGVAKSVLAATLPVEYREHRGPGVRDVLKLPNGQDLALQSLADAKPVDLSRNASGIDSVDNICNGEEVEIETPDGTTKKTIPFGMADVIELVNRRTCDKLMRLGDSLFIYDSYGVCWFTKPAALFGWMQQFCRVDWHERTGFVSKAEFFHELQRTAPRYVAIEKFPHEPKIESHFYACEQPAAGDGTALDTVVNLFRPETVVDADLIRAMIVTLFWGGAAGCRPAFVITSDAGRGAGKSKCLEIVSHIVGGYIDVSSNEDIATLKGRLLSAEALEKRIAGLDNIKSLRFSWAELESLMTSATISGKRMYVGEASRPNTLLWVVTLNGIALSTDLAQRCVIIKLRGAAPGENLPTWHEDAIRFVNENRSSIIADCIAYLQQQATVLASYSRWSSWEADVLSRLPEPGEAQKVIAERQGEADVDRDEADLIEDFFSRKLESLGYYADRACVRIPNSIAAAWFSDAVGERVTKTKSTQRIKQMSKERQLKCLRLDAGHAHGRCFIWTGQFADPSQMPENDLEKCIARHKAESEAEHAVFVQRERDRIEGNAA